MVIPGAQHQDQDGVTVTLDISRVKKFSSISALPYHAENLVENESKFLMDLFSIKISRQGLALHVLASLAHNKGKLSAGK